MTQQFASLVKMYAKLVGKPNLPVTSVPHPISRVLAQKCREYIEGNDPVTGRPVIDEIVEALTKPLTEEEKLSRLEERPVPRLLGPDTEENLHRYFLENRMTDYLPIMLPTEERVAEMTRLQKKMTAALRESIIRYKLSVMTEAHRTPRFSGYFIYKAFLDEGIRDFEGVTRYLIENGIEMGT